MTLCAKEIYDIVSHAKWYEGDPTKVSGDAFLHLPFTFYGNHAYVVSHEPNGPVRLYSTWCEKLDGVYHARVDKPFILKREWGNEKRFRNLLKRYA